MDPQRIINDWPAVADALDVLEARDAVRRLYAKDDTLWSDDPAHRQVTANRLGWLDVAGGTPGWSNQIAEFVNGVREDGLHRVVLAGMGGSSLAPEVFVDVLDGSGAEVEILDSTHPEVVDDRLSDLDNTLVLVSSKSGTTEETFCFGSYAAAVVPSPRHLAAITDPGSALGALARSAGWRAVFENPADIGGRYSALSLFGMVPAALAGIDIDDVWARAQRMKDLCGPDTALADNPGAQLGAFMAGLAAQGRDKLTLLASQRLASLGDWVEQLVAESTGKQGLGVVPVVGEPVGEPHEYGPDRAFVAVQLGDEEVPGAAALAEAGHPVLTIVVAEAAELGAEFLRWEVATALAAVVLGVNPFDEPNVAESKANTKAVLDAVVAGEALPEPEQGDVIGLLESVRPGDYLSIQCYLPPDAATASALNELRVAFRAATGSATTVGWGPRFLHSTGQLHKGGPDNVVSLQIVDEPEEGPSIPDRDYDFPTLVRAQAVGDLRSLRAHDRRVAQVPVFEAEELVALADAVAEGLKGLDGPPSSP